MEKRNIYIERGGEWYDYSHCWNQFPLDLLIEETTKPDARNVRTDKREFEIGSLVKFENCKDWTEVVECCGCETCGLNHGACNTVICAAGSRINNTSIVFKKYTPETTEKTEEQKGDFFVIMPAPTEGLKYDSGKLRPGLFPMECFEEISKVLTYGANKYTPDNWKKVSPDRYIDALWRHWIAWQTGEKNDSESGLSHAAHFATNAVFLLYFEMEKQESEAGK